MVFNRRPQAETTEADPFLAAMAALERRLSERLDHAIGQAREQGREQARAMIDEALAANLANGAPGLHPLGVAQRNLRHALWNGKVMASALVELLYAQRRAGPHAPAVPEPVAIGLGGRVCRQADVESSWFRHWCGATGNEPRYHRKLWEHNFILQALWEAGMLQPGRQGLGFAVGTEMLPAFLASRQVEVLATDLPGGDARAVDWHNNQQHASSPEALFRPDLLDRASFDQHCRFRPLDMNHIPPDLHGKFDFCWSACAMEHLGSVAQGLDFLEASARCLKPGGIAVHTTELTLDRAGAGIDNWPTVLFSQAHIAEATARLAAAGHRLLPVCWESGADILDLYVDVPPYPHQHDLALPYPEVPHLRLAVDGFAATSLGIVIQAGGG